MWFVYILLCKDMSLYTGISTDPDRRFLEHVSQKGGHYTRAHPPIKRVYLEKIATKSAALKREHEIKSWSRQKKLLFLSDK